MKLDLNETEVGIFLAVMDSALKGVGGIAAFGAVSAAMAILESAKRAELEANAAEEARLASATKGEGDGPKRGVSAAPSRTSNTPISRMPPLPLATIGAAPSYQY